MNPYLRLQLIQTNPYLSVKVKTRVMTTEIKVIMKLRTRTEMTSETITSLSRANNFTIEANTSDLLELNQLLSPQEIEPFGVVAVDESLSSDSNSGLTDDNICDGVAGESKFACLVWPGATSYLAFSILKELHFTAVPAVNDGLNSHVIQLGWIIVAVESDESVARRQRSVILGTVIRVRQDCVSRWHALPSR
ncbi:hypothetical protein PsorP6_003580 [Peronosclerospora sorghi]|uniref:Uncharacterized protein n=1 Tax=Peronosclerospora sorghi TaxID=230839 RepID=A0ACC0VQQ7_9STRA|nr:hypothetical protein PsorP6_003580 [Peronosclerospora sorghi]